MSKKMSLKTVNLVAPDKNKDQEVNYISMLYADGLLDPDGLVKFMKEGNITIKVPEDRVDLSNDAIWRLGIRLVDDRHNVYPLGELSRLKDEGKRVTYAVYHRENGRFNRSRLVVGSDEELNAFCAAREYILSGDENKFRKKPADVASQVVSADAAVAATTDGALQLTGKLGPLNDLEMELEKFLELSMAERERRLKAMEKALKEAQKRHKQYRSASESRKAYDLALKHGPREQLTFSDLLEYVEKKRPEIKEAFCEYWGKNPKIADVLKEFDIKQEDVEKFLDETRVAASAATPQADPFARPTLTAADVPDDDAGFRGVLAEKLRGYAEQLMAVYPESAQRILDFINSYPGAFVGDLVDGLGIDTSVFRKCVKDALASSNS